MRPIQRQASRCAAPAKATPSLVLLLVFLFAVLLSISPVGAVLVGEELPLQFETVHENRVLHSNCSLYKLHKPPQRITRENKYSLWPDLMTATDLESGESLFGMDEAMEMIWRNQNPPDCRKAKYLLMDAWFEGFGSETHMYGLGLGIALDLGYVALQMGGWNWRFRNPHCDAQLKRNLASGMHPHDAEARARSLECYYAPLSKCTMHDVVHAAYSNASHVFASQASRSTSSWSAAEDDALRALVLKVGPKGQWTQIAEQLPGQSKTSLQCLHRWRQVVGKTVAASAPQGSPMHKFLHRNERTIADLSTPRDGVLSVNRVLHATVHPKNGRIILQPNHTHLTANVFVLPQELYFQFRKFVPTVFHPMLRCGETLSAQEKVNGKDVKSKQAVASPPTLMHESARYLWWRAISISYILRPNSATQALLDRERDHRLRTSDGRCVSMYIRHGDKGTEMQLVQTAAYLQTAQKLFDDAERHLLATGEDRDGLALFADRLPSPLPLLTFDTVNFTRPDSPAATEVSDGLHQQSSSPTAINRPKTVHRQHKHVPGPGGAPHANKHYHKAKGPARRLTETSTAAQRLVYVSSDDFTVFPQAEQWAAAQSTLANVTIRRSELSRLILSDRRQVIKQYEMETSFPKSRELEYVSYLLHLLDSITCRAAVCTLPSNYCRVIDELRATVGGKANRIFVDLSPETCPQLVLPSTPAHAQTHVRLNPQIMRAQQPTKGEPCVRRHALGNYLGAVYDPRDRLWR